MTLITQSKREDLSVRGVGVLDLIAADPPAARRRYARVRVALPPLPKPAAQSYERTLNRQLHASGSGVAASTMLATTLAYVAYLASTGTSLGGSWRHFAIGTAMVLAGAALGKVLGLFYWNLVLRRTALRLRRLVTPTAPIPPRTRSVNEEFPPTASVSPGSFN